MLWLQTKSGATQILNRRWPSTASGIYRDVASAKGNVEKGSKRRGMEEPVLTHIPVRSKYMTTKIPRE